MNRRRLIYVAGATLLGALLAVLSRTTSPPEQTSPADPRAAQILGSRPALASLRPPNLRAAGGGELKINNVPGSPGYDPTRFKGFLRIHEIFDQEPRNETWAKPVEAWLSERFGQDLRQAVPEVSNLALECRTSSCRMTWEGPPEALKKVKELHMALYPGTGRTSRTTNDLTVIYGGGFLADKGTPDQLIAWWSERRPQALKNVAQGRSATQVIPVDGWPKE